MYDIQRCLDVVLATIHAFWNVLNRLSFVIGNVIIGFGDLLVAMLLFMIILSFLWKGHKE